MVCYHKNLMIYYEFYFSLKVVCHVGSLEDCCANYSVAISSNYQSCFWNPRENEFQCPKVVFADKSFYATKCPESYLPDCDENKLEML